MIFLVMRLIEALGYTNLGQLQTFGEYHPNLKIAFVKSVWLYFTSRQNEICVTKHKLSLLGAKSNSFSIARFIHFYRRSWNLRYRARPHALVSWFVHIKVHFEKYTLILQMDSKLSRQMYALKYEFSLGKKTRFA